MDDIKRAAKIIGSLGGKKTLKKHGTEHFKRISKLGKIALGYAEEKTETPTT